MIIHGLINAYAQMYEHTKNECATSCRVPQSCCDEMYCEMARQNIAQEGLNVQPTGHPKLMFMGPTGCVVPPHLRPLCTLHTCAINGLGFKPGDEAWTTKYFELRENIEILEMSK